MENTDLLDGKESAKIEHDVLFSKSKVELRGVFAWIFYIQFGMWFLIGLLHFIIDIAKIF